MKSTVRAATVNGLIINWVSWTDGWPSDGQYWPGWCSAGVRFSLQLLLHVLGASTISTVTVIQHYNSTQWFTCIPWAVRLSWLENAYSRILHRYWQPHNNEEEYTKHRLTINWPSQEHKTVKLISKTVHL